MYGMNVLCVYIYIDTHIYIDILTSMQLEELEQVTRTPTVIACGIHRHQSSERGTTSSPSTPNSCSYRE